ncbi:MAG: rRNA maturation RNase YbeY [Candidatus Levybacteria bacterium RIFCSPLOWO2_12_FULL_37_14]|nr:MAG: putative rRNA maturation factor [Candidatus Levybacteria bacterium GW2011_GWC2_37_7]KKQ42571.1 MAG: putative rRNA maturation factor [Candidatus Levybacteria bacterium GW2011_GWB1_37_8]OGH50359.1 MAG: rRNA maturation RNase YbeY [Candidatus Levybacteria bacterium RIFCSPLOWO2_12_FULL_37_14]
MEEIQIPIFVESRYRVNRKRIKKAISKVLAEHEIKGPAEVSVAIVGDRKMRALSKKYKGEDKTRNILSFSLSEGESTHLGSEVLKLGDIVISYPQIIREASVEEVLVDDKIDTLIEHGMLHLLGINHE